MAHTMPINLTLACILSLHALFSFRLLHCQHSSSFLSYVIVREGEDEEDEDHHQVGGEVVEEEELSAVNPG